MNKTNLLVKIAYNIGYCVACSSIAGWNNNSVRQAILDKRVDELFDKAWSIGICDKDRHWLSDEYETAYSSGYRDAQNEAKRYE